MVISVLLLLPMSMRRDKEATLPIAPFRPINNVASIISFS